jgi:hypothetical protein
MKVPYVEDLANHHSPESCGERAGTVIYFFFIHFLRWFSYFAGALSHRGTVYLMMVLFKEGDAAWECCGFPGFRVFKHVLIAVPGKIQLVEQFTH